MAAFLVVVGLLVAIFLDRAIGAVLIVGGIVLWLLVGPVTWR